MKKLLLCFLSLFLAMNLIFAGGIVTNTNQSASWARMLVRDASTSIDAVYYNPAGLTKLSDGLHLYLSNQSIFQKRAISNTLLPNKEFKGDVTAPLYPNVYAAYKKDRIAFSLGFTPIGGGGSADFASGVPMIELPLLQLLTLPNVTGYSYNASFKAKSMYLGIQGGISFAINDMISIYAGARYVMAINSYNGTVKDISVITAAGTSRADAYMTNLAGLATAGATNANNAGNGMQPLISGGAGGFTFAQAEGGAAITHAQRLQMEGGLLQLGYTQTQVNAMTLSTAQASYFGAVPVLNAQAAQLTGGAALLADQTADVKQKGSGITPIIGVNLSLMDNKLDIGLKYEYNTNIYVKNETPVGKGFTTGFTSTGQPIEMFPDGAKTSADIPAMISVGVAYKFTDKFSTQIGYHTYFDQYAGWSKTATNPVISNVDKNFWELGIGFEYSVSDKILLSCGYLSGNTGANAYYYSDLSYSLNSNTIGLGGQYKINDKLSLELGGFNTWYTDKTVTSPVTPTSIQTYKKSNYAVAIGLDFNFGGTK